MSLVGYSPWGPTGSRMKWLSMDAYIYIYTYVCVCTYIYVYIFVVAVQSFSRVQLFMTPWTAAARLPCPSPSPGACSNSCPLSWWCHPTILSSVAPFSSCLLSFPASVSWLFATNWQKYWWPKYLRFSSSISPSSEHSELISFWIDWFDLLAAQGTLKSLLQHPVQKHQFFGIQPSLWSNSHIHTWLCIYKYIYILLQCFAGLSFPGGWASANLSPACVSAESALFWFVCLFFWLQQEGLGQVFWRTSFHSPYQGLSSYYWVHGWAGFLSGPGALDVRSHNTHKGAFVQEWMSILLSEGEDKKRNTLHQYDASITDNAVSFWI